MSSSDESPSDFDATSFLIEYLESDAPEVSFNKKSLVTLYLALKEQSVFNKKIVILMMKLIINKISSEDIENLIESENEIDKALVDFAQSFRQVDEGGHE
jgi:hypothetical protein